MFTAINPTNGKLIRSLPFDDDATIIDKISLAQTAFHAWRKIPLKERSGLLSEAGKILLSEKEDYARLITEEMGKPIGQGRAEIEKCAWVCKYYAENAEAFLEPKMVKTDAGKSYISYEPEGVLLAVMPWNFPFWQVFRFAAPNITAGNTILLKHAPNVPGCCVAIDDIFFKAGFPEDVLAPLYAPVDRMELIISNPIVRGVTLTGSTDAGRSIAALSGRYLKKSVLELGGSDPFIVLDDADIALAAEACAKSKLNNAGQSCIGAKRIIVLEKVYDEFLKHFVPIFSNATQGDPLAENTTIGPMARLDLRDTLHQQIESSIINGAKCLCGGQIPDKAGAWYPPTVLTDVTVGQAAYEEELFGPVTSIIKVKDQEEAIAVANDTSYGLGAAIFTSDIKKGERIAREELDAGACFVNEFVKSDPRLPFGGVKTSGYGRELSVEGMTEFMNVKTVWVK